MGFLVLGYYFGLPSDLTKDVAGKGVAAVPMFNIAGLVCYQVKTHDELAADADKIINNRDKLCRQIIEGGNLTFPDLTVDQTKAEAALLSDDDVVKRTDEALAIRPTEELELIVKQTLHNMGFPSS